MKTENIKVFLRLRPEEDHVKGEHSLTVSNSNTVIVNPASQGHGKGRNHTDATEKSFTFDRVFDCETSQEEVFENVAPLVDSVIEGYNATIFAYGSTGSGKTHSISGTSSAPGIVPKAINKLFSIAQTKTNENPDAIVLVHMAYVELYNNTFRDLLEHTSAVTSVAKTFRETSTTNIHDQTKKIEIHTTKDGMVFLSGSSTLRTPVTTAAQALALYAKGTKYRATGATNCNEHSSRSHSILTFHVECRELSNGTTSKESTSSVVRMGKLHLIDLAGSERLSISGAQGEELLEAQNINLSLATLGDVLSALSKLNSKSSSRRNKVRSNTVIPYRNSKLTYLLKDSLGGNSKTVMLATVRLPAIYRQQTLTTLMYASRTKTIQNHTTVNTDVIGSSETSKLVREIDRLKQQLKQRQVEFEKLSSLQLKDQDGSENHERMHQLANLSRENEEEKERLQSFLQQVVHSHSSTLAAEQEKYSILQDRLGVYRSAYHEQREELKRLRETLVGTGTQQSQTEELHLMVKQLTAALESSRREVSSLTEERNYLNTQLSMLRTQLSDAETHNKHILNQLDKQIEEASKQTNSRVEQSKTELELEESAKALLAINLEYRDYKKRVEGKIHGMESKFRNLIASKEQDTKKLHVENQQLQEQLNQLRCQVREQAIGHEQRLRDQVTQTQLEQARVSSLEQQSMQLNEQLQTLRATQERLTKQHQQEKQDVLSQVEKSEDGIASLEHQLDDAKKQTRDVETKLHTLSATCQTQAESLLSYKSKFQKMESQLNKHAEIERKYKTLLKNSSLQVSELENKIHVQQLEIENQHVVVDSVQSALSEATSRNKVLENELAVARSRLEEEAEMLRSAKSKITALESELVEKTENLASMQRKKRHVLDELQVLKDKQQNEYKRIIQENQELRDALDKLDHTSKDTAKQLRDLLRKLHATETKCADLDRELQNESKAKQQLITKQQLMTAQHAQELAVLTEDAELCRKQASEYAGEVQRLKAEQLHLGTVQTDLERKQDELRNCHEQLDKQNVDLNQAMQKCSMLQDQLQESQLQQKEAVRKQQHTAALLTRANSELTELKTASETLQSESEILKSKINDLSEENEEYSASLAQFKTREVQLADNIAAEAAKLETCKIRADDAETQLQTVVESNQKLQNELQEREDSLSMHQRQIALMKEQHDAERNELKDVCDARIEEIMKDLTQASENLSKAENLVLLKNEEIEVLKRASSAAESDLEELLQQLRNTEATKAADAVMYQERISSVQHKYEQLQQAVRVREEMNAKLVEQLKNVELQKDREVNNLEEQVRDVTDAHQQDVANYRLLQERNTCLEKKLAVAETKHLASEQLISKLEGELKALETSLDNSNGMILAVKEQAHDWQHRYEESKSDYDEVCNKLQLAEASRREVENQSIDVQNQVVSTLRVDVSRFERENKELREKLKESQASQQKFQLSLAISTEESRVLLRQMQDVQGMIQISTEQTCTLEAQVALLVADGDKSKTELAQALHELAEQVDVARSITQKFEDVKSKLVREEECRKDLMNSTQTCIEKLERENRMASEELARARLSQSQMQEGMRALQNKLDSQNQEVYNAGRVMLDEVQELENEIVSCERFIHLITGQCRRLEAEYQATLKQSSVSTTCLQDQIRNNATKYVEWLLTCIQNPHLKSAAVLTGTQILSSGELHTPSFHERISRLTSSIIAECAQRDIEASKCVEKLVVRELAQIKQGIEFCQQFVDNVDIPAILRPAFQVFQERLIASATNERESKRKLFVAEQALKVLQQKLIEHEKDVERQAASMAKQHDAHIERLQEKINDIKLRNELLASENDGLKLQIQETVNLEQHYEEKAQEYEGIKQQFVATAQENETLKQHYEEKAQEYEDIKQQFVATAQETVILEQQYEEKAQEYEDIKQQFVATAQENETLKQQYEEKVQENVGLLTQCSALEQDIGQLTVINQVRLAELDHFQTNYKEQNKFIDHVRDQLRDKSVEYENQVRESVQLKTQVTELQQRIKTAHDTSKDAEARFAQENTVFRETVASLKQQISSLQEENKNLQLAHRERAEVAQQVEEAVERSRRLLSEEWKRERKLIDVDGNDEVTKLQRQVLERLGSLESATKVSRDRTQRQELQSLLQRTSQHFMKRLSVFEARLSHDSGKLQRVEDKLGAYLRSRSMQDATHQDVFKAASFETNIIQQSVRDLYTKFHSIQQHSAYHVNEQALDTTSRGALVENESTNTTENASSEPLELYDLVPASPSKNAADALDDSIATEMDETRAILDNANKIVSMLEFSVLKAKESLTTSTHRQPLKRLLERSELRDPMCSGEWEISTKDVVLPREA